MAWREGALEAACAIHSDRLALKTCARCGTFSCEECLREDLAEEALCAACMARASTSQLPWDSRGDVGWVKAWFKSLGPILLRPSSTFATARSEGDAGGSLLFALVAWFIGCFTTFGAFVLFGALLPNFDKSSSDSDSAVRAILVGSYGLMIVLMPLFGMVSTIIMAALEHLVMMVFGKPRGFDTTLKGASLSLAPYILGVIPVCGLYVAPLWVIVVKVFAYKGLHRSTTGVAVAGALALPILGLVLGCAAYLATFMLLMAVGNK